MHNKKCFFGMSQIIDVILDFPIPMVAGMSSNSGPLFLGFSLAVDYRIASKNATLMINPNNSYGIPPASLLSFFLIKNIGPARTMELMLSHPELSIEEAYQLGLVSQIVDEENVESQCIELLNALNPFSRDAISETRCMIQPDKAEINKYIETTHERYLRNIYKMSS
ncbi:MAG: enoyl-CoA hydratase/isomerase family protein [Desulfobacter sp.]|nr:MAG: enoyl-CoA hydratase/isomerase family protein [Desulfobacter sp.]